MQRKINLIPKNDDTCGWINILPTQKPHAALNGLHNADWVIIGSGFTGLAFARQMALAKPDACIILLDAQGAGEGASSRNSGFGVDTSIPDGPYNAQGLAEFQRINRINCAGIDWLRDITREHDIDCDWREVGVLRCGADSSSNQAADNMVLWLQASDVEHVELSSDDLAKRMGTPHYTRGIWVKRDVLVQPASLVRGLIANLPQNVEVYGDTMVTRIATHDGKLHVTCQNAEVIADNITLASNAFLHAMTPKPSHTFPLTMTASITEPLNADQQARLGNPQDWGLLSLHGTGATLRYTTDRRILIRNTVAYKPDTVLNRSEMRNALLVHETGLRKRFAMLDDLRIAHSWQGVLSFSRNHTSVFGKLADGVFAAGCYNASGLTRGSAMGKALADFANGEENQLIEDVSAYPSAQWMPPRPILDAALKFEVARRKIGVGADG